MNLSSFYALNRSRSPPPDITTHQVHCSSCVSFSSTVQCTEWVREQSPAQDSIYWHTERNWTSSLLVCRLSTGWAVFPPVVVRASPQRPPLLAKQLQSASDDVDEERRVNQRRLRPDSSWPRRSNRGLYNNSHTVQVLSRILTHPAGQLFAYYCPELSLMKC